MNIIDMLLRRGYWARCQHRGHWTRLRTCLRGRTYDGYCGENNCTCWGHCGRGR